MTATTHPEWNQYTEALDVATAFPDAINGRTVLITGVSKLGIGFSTAEAFASQSPKLLILAGRTIAKLQECIDVLKPKYPSVEYRTLVLDLQSQAAVRNAAREVLSWADAPAIHFLINNAGVMNIPERTLSSDGLEMQFATNHIGHFLFTNLILSKIIAAAKSAPNGTVRIVNVSSRGVVYSPVRFSDINHDKKIADLPEDEKADLATLTQLHYTYGSNSDAAYIPMVAYGQSKTANVLFGLGLNARLYDKHGILSLGLHPGGILTELGRHADPQAMKMVIAKAKEAGLNFKTLGQGSSTTLTAALDPKLGLPVKGGAGKGGNLRETAGKAGDNWEGKGAYLSDCQIDGGVPLWVTSWDGAEKLWQSSEELVGEKFEF